jgi:hypothetical protein
MFIPYLSRAVPPIPYHFKRYRFIITAIFETNCALAPKALESPSNLKVVALEALSRERFVEREDFVIHCENRRSIHTDEFLLPAVRYEPSVTLTYWVTLVGRNGEVVSGRRKDVLLNIECDAVWSVELRVSGFWP